LFTLAAQVDDPVVVGIAAMRSLRVKIESGTFDQADGLVEILDEYARFDPYVLANSTSARAVLAHARGEFDDGLDLADRALEISHSEPDARAVHLSFISMIKRERGELAELLPTLEYVVETYPGVTGFHPLLGLAYVAAGQHEAAETLLQHEIDTGLTDHPMNPLWLASVALVALLAIELESVPAAEMLTPVLEPWAGRPATSVVSYYGFVDELVLSSMWPSTTRWPSGSAARMWHVSEFVSFTIGVIQQSARFCATRTRSGNPGGSGEDS
jgi:hypothetical protein